MLLQANTLQQHGGIQCQKIFLVPDLKETQWGDILEHVHSLAPVFPDDVEWDEFHFVKGSASASEDVVVIDGAEFVRFTLTMELNSHSPYYRSQLARLKGKKWHIKLNNADGQTWCIGGRYKDACSLKVERMAWNKERSEGRRTYVTFTKLSRFYAAQFPF